jgi:mRNA-degrading endonuclease RelE of RelBE toxin-antitoxin system
MVVFHRLAAQEARAAESWYASRSPEAAVRFRAEVIAATQRISTEGVSHPIAATRFRYVRVHRFPYRLIFVPMSPEKVVVVAVSHHRRRAGYWRRRT